MPAPSPYTPPRPSVPQHQITPRFSHAHRRSDRARSDSQDSSTERSRFSAARRRLLPSTSSAPSRSPSPDLLENSTDPKLDEDLKDPHHFINAFSVLNGPIVRLNHLLNEKLERYLVKLNLTTEEDPYMPGTSRNTGVVSNVNFAEAALVVQGSTRIYGKKVDLLFDAALNLFRLLSSGAPLEELENEEGGETTQTPKGTKRSRLALENRDLAEDISAVENFSTGKKIDRKRVACQRLSELLKNISCVQSRGNLRLLPPNIPRLVRKTKSLGTNVEEMQRVNIRRVPQFGRGLESRGFIDEYRLNDIVRRQDRMIVDHFIPECVEDASLANPISQVCNDSGVDSAPPSVYNITDDLDSITEITSVVDTSAVEASDDISKIVDESMVTNRTETSNDFTLIENRAGDVDDSGEQAGDVDDSGEQAGDVVDSGEQANKSIVASETEASIDDGFLSEGGHENSDLEECIEIKVGDTSSQSGQNELIMSEHERNGTETSGFFSETGLADTESLDEREGATDLEEQLKRKAEITLHAGMEVENSVMEEQDNKEITTLKEVEFNVTPRRNKRKLKSFKLPCKLSLLLPEKKKRTSRNTRAADLWRPSQSPCSSSSSNYPQSPVSYPSASPDHHSLSLMLEDDDGPQIQLDALSDSDNEGDYFDPPPDGQPQVNHWIRNYQKDLLSTDKEVTLSDRVAQWQELIMPRLDANLEHGPYSHAKYLPILIELVAKDGWPAPPLTSESPSTSAIHRRNETHFCDSVEELILTLDWRNKPCEHTKTNQKSDREKVYIPYDPDFVDSKECDEEWGSERFFGFKSHKQVRRRGVILVQDSLDNREHTKSLFSVLSRVYNWGLKDCEVYALNYQKWMSDKSKWLESKVGAGVQRRKNWTEWTEEDDNVESNCKVDMADLLKNYKRTDLSKPVSFPTLTSGFRKEEVSRLLFTALHLASQEHIKIISSDGVLNSMKISLCPKKIFNDI